VVHNLRATVRGTPDSPLAARPWAQSFDDAVKAALAGRDDKALIAYETLEGASTAVATPDHYYPFLYALGAAGATEKATAVYEGFQAGTLSMRCIQFG
jgi:4,5-DOPA dioxygenase extradiol